MKPGPLEGKPGITRNAVGRFAQFAVSHVASLFSVANGVIATGFFNVYCCEFFAFLPYPTQRHGKKCNRSGCRKKNEDAAERLGRARLDPTYVVESSSGSGKLHVYFLLSEALTPAEQKEAMRRLCARTGADSSKAVGNSVLRIAGTTNWKTGEPRDVRLIDFNTIARYSRAALLAAGLLGTTGASEPATGGYTLVGDATRGTRRGDGGGTSREDVRADPRNLSRPRSAQMTDRAVLRHLLRANNAQAFRALARGDNARHNNNPSEGDAALFTYIAFYTQDAEQIVRIAKATPRYRNFPDRRTKWARVDYLDKTLDRALTNQTARYGVVDDAGDAAWLHTITGGRYDCNR